MLRSSLLLFTAALVLANGEPILRNGEFSRYYLYTRDVSGIELNFQDRNTVDIKSGPTVVVIHGHEGSYRTSLNPDLTRELLETDENLNVILVDWSIYASMSYTVAENAVLSIGNNLAALLNFQQIPVASTHLIGFNLGAHIAGVAGKNSGGIARITGLDPSRCSIRLGRTDASYVEVIHTDGNGLLSNGLGVQLGHADFFPNGGSSQPGCWGNHTCSHNRAWLYYAASINHNTFNARCCNSMLQKNLNLCRGTYLAMGNNKLSKIPCASGIYRVNTRSSYPY